MVRSMLQKSPKDRVVPLASMASMAFFNGGNPNHSLTGIFSPSKFPYHPCMVYIYPILVDLYGKCEGKYTIHGWCGHDIGFLQQFFSFAGLGGVWNQVGRWNVRSVEGQLLELLSEVTWVYLSNEKKSPLVVPWDVYWGMKYYPVR